MERWNQQIKLARYMLLGTVIITVVNLAFLLGNSEIYLTYCAALPYYLVWLGKIFDNGWYVGTVNGEFTATGLAMAGVILAGLLLLWWLARDHKKWLMVAMAVMAIDLAALLWIAFTLFSSPLSCLWEVVIHIAVIWEIWQGLQAWKKKEAALAEDLRQTELV